MAHHYDSQEMISIQAFYMKDGLGSWIRLILRTIDYPKMKTTVKIPVNTLVHCMNCSETEELVVRAFIDDHRHTKEFKEFMSKDILRIADFLVN